MDSSKTFTYFIKAQTGDLERGFKRSGTEAQQLSGKLGKLERSTLDVREAALKVERAQRSAARATERYGKDSLEAASAQLRLERAQERANASTRTGARDTGLLAGSLKRAAGAAVGLAAGYASIQAAKDAVDTTVDLGKATLKLHKNFGLSIKSASQFAAVMKSRDIDAKQGAQAFGTLGKQIVSLGEGSKGAAKAFGLLGLSQKDLKGKDFAQQLGLVSDKFKELGPGTDRTTAGMRLFGRGWQTLLPLIGGGNAAMQRQLELADKYGATLGGKTVKDVEKMIQAQREQRLAMLGIQVTIGSLLIPAMTKLSGAMSDAALWLRSLSAQFRSGDRSAKGAASTLRSLASAGGDVAATFKSVERAIRPVTSKVIPAVAGAASDAAGVFRGLARTVRRVFSGDIAGAFSSFKSTARSAMSYVVNIVKAATAPMRAAGAAIGRALVGGIKGALSGVGSIASGIARALAGILNRAIPDKIPLPGLPDIDLPDNPIKLARGGLVRGGTPGRDSVPALLMPGEHVLTTREVQRAGGHGAIFAIRRALGGGTQASGIGMADGGAVGGGTWGWARAFARKYGLTITSSYRTPQHNAAVGGVPNSYHTRGSAANPQAFDFTPPSSAAAAAARSEGAAEVLIHNAGSGLHLHVGGPPSSAAAVVGRAGGSSGWQDGVCTWYKPSAGGINGREGAGAWPGHPIYDTTWGCAAPPAYAFGTLIEFRYNGKSVQVPVMDRGGAIQGSHFDLLPGPARALGMQGAGKVNVKFRVAGKASAAAVKAPKPMRSKGVQAKSVKGAGFGHTGKYFEKLREDRAERAGTAMTSFLDAQDNAVNAPYQLALTTPGKDDDLAAAQGGKRYADRLVASYAQRVKDGTATAADLENAISYAGMWQGRIDEAKAPDPTVDLAALIQGLRDEQKATREFGERIVATTGGAVITGLIGQLASTGIGTSFNLANQSAGRGAGQHATY